MSRTKIDYGIDLGTTNSAISRIENGEVVIKKTETLKDTMPSCVFINKKKIIQVGDSAYNSLKRDKLTAMKNNSEDTNAFIEFKRTMGTDKHYFSSNLGKEISSEELSAEVLKALKSFIKDDDVSAAVITVPAAFKNNQIDATRRAAELAGFKYIEVLQEPVAAATAYGLENKNKDGFWLVFDFGGGTFDAALLKVEEGIMKVIDTEGDNYLGGKNLDFAIVDEIIFPYIEENYVIDSFLEDDEKKQILRNAMKFYAEETKIKLSFSSTHNILSDLGDIPGEDDEGEEFELDITVTQQDMERVLSPIFQKAIDLCKILLKRNNLIGNELSSLILVGGPTFSPVLRQMLTKQIQAPDTSVDPMTVVSKGAAIYASTVDLSDEIKEQTRDRLKIQLEISHESSTVEMEEYITVKILADKTDGHIPDKVFVEFSRNDKAWSSGKIEINDIGEVIDVSLVEGKTNSFEVSLYDEKGSLLDCEPNHFSIIQGVAGIGSMQVLPYNYGIEIYQRATGKNIFTQIQGLERNKALPVVGARNGLKTPKDIRAGLESDFITIPLYQGEHNSDGTRAIYNEHVYDAKISGADLPAFLPAGSDVDLTISIDKSQNIKVSAYFPYLDHTAEIEVPVQILSVETEWLEAEIENAQDTLWNIHQESPSHIVDQLEQKINEIRKELEANPTDVDTKQKVLTHLRKILKEIDDYQDKNEWGSIENELNENFEQLREDCQKSENPQLVQSINQFANQMNEIIRKQDLKLAKLLLEQMRTLSFEINRYQHMITVIAYFQHNFNEINWTNPRLARELIDKAMQKVLEQVPENELIMIIREIIALDPNSTERNLSGNNNSILIG